MSIARKNGTLCDAGVVGLGVMGRNLAHNLAGKGFRTAAYDIRPDAVSAAVGYAKGLPVEGFSSMEAFAAGLEKPRRAIILVTAGPAVDSVVAELQKYFELGDIIIDCGNSFYKDTMWREKALWERGIFFMGTGISGGEEGALRGPSIMAGGDEKAWEQAKNLLLSACAKVDGEPCCAHVGPDGAGHFVKMVHNGIEYADMQLIAESYFLMRRLLGLSSAEIADVFEEWNRGRLNSYLIEITVRVLRKEDAPGIPLVDKILDRAGQKGTGVWTSQEALSLGVAVPSITEAVYARALSAAKEERLCASKQFRAGCEAFEGDRGEWVSKIGEALYTFKIFTYAQGFDLLRKASEQFGWNLNLGDIAKIWRGGCIIRAQFLNRITEFYQNGGGGRNLLFDGYFGGSAAQGLPSARQVVAKAALCGVPLPCCSSALGYYDSLRSDVLPANLIQAQRDFFGAHTYERNDRPGVFHTQWE